MTNYKILFDYFEKNYNTSDSFNDILLNLLKAFEKGSTCISLSNEEKDILNSFNVVGEDRPLVIKNNLVYFQKYYLLEQAIVSKIKKLISLNKFKMITGGPGTGKTTKVSIELASRLIEDIDYVIALAAPTGKASIRMKESIKNTLYGSSYSVEFFLKDKVSVEKREAIISKIDSLQPVTIHNLLGAFPQRTDYRYSNKKLEKHIIVVDEASMIDIDLMQKLLLAIDTKVLKTIYLIGDKNQLTSVDVGSVFKDLSESIKDEANQEMLTINYRAKEAPGIQKLIKDIEDENVDEIAVKNYESVVFNDFNNDLIDNSFVEEMILNYKNAKTIKEALSIISHSMILTAYRVGLMGSVMLNRNIIRKYSDLRFIPYILTKNDYNRNLYNGDIGILDKETNLVHFDNGVKAELIYLSNIEPAFAITIHKSQGSEYDNVYMILKDDNKESDFITKELIYTGVSRAKLSLTIVSGEETLLNGISKKADRASGLSNVRWKE